MIDVPVSLYATKDNDLLVVGGGEYFTTPFPVLPFQYIKADEGERGAEKVNLIGGGAGYIKRKEHDSIPVRPAMSGQKMIPQFDVILWLVKEHPDMVRGLLGRPIEPYPIFLDIETASTTGHFSRPDRDPILAIQVKYPDDKRVEIFYQNSQTSEKDVIRYALSYMQESPSGMHPDLVVGYFINKFDMPYIRTRCKVLDIYNEYEKLHRIEDEMLYYPTWTLPKTGKAGKVEILETARGLMNLDLYIHAKADPVLQSLSSRSMKNVASYYGSDTVYDIESEEKGDMEKLMRTDIDKFLRYSESDIIQTEYLYNIYASLLEASSSLLECPMIMTHRMSSGQKSYLALYRECRTHGYFSTRDNIERYAHLYERAPKFQGALVDCFQKGYFPNTIYVDAKCMHGNTEILTDQGYVEVKSISAGDRVYSDKGYRKILHVQKTRRTGYTEIETVDGNVITVSREHRFPVYQKVRKAGYSQKDIIVDIQAKDLKQGDILMTCYDYPLECDESEVRPIEEQRLMAEIIGIFDAEGGSDTYSTDRVRHDRNGSIQKDIRYSYVTFSIHKDEKEFRSRIEYIMKTLFNVQPSISKKKGSNGIALQYCTHKTYDQLSDMLKKRNDILSHKDLCRHYLRGLFTGDGDYNKARKSISLRQSSKNKHIIDFAHKCLIRCGFPHTLSDKQKAVAYKKPPEETTIHAQYRIEIPTRYVKQFMKEIGFIGEKGSQALTDCTIQSKPRDYIRNGFRLSKIRRVYHDTKSENDMYDITVEDQAYPYFYANNILTHNSMYPNIMHDFNVSYDRYDVVEEIEFYDWAVRNGVDVPHWIEGTPSEDVDWDAIGYHPDITVERDGDDTFVYVPDENYALVLKFKMNFRDDGFMRIMIDKYNGIRDEYKTKMREVEGKNDNDSRTSYLNYSSMQQTAKIINNTFFGIQGNRYYEIADLPAAIFITAIGRWLMRQMMGLFGKKAVIEIDTDGVLLNRDEFDMGIDDINKHLRTKIHEKFGIPYDKMNFKLEFEGAGSVYMYRTKNYIHRLDEKPDELKSKGSAFKGYDKAPVFRRAVELMANAVMFKIDNDEDAYHRAATEARDIHNLPLDEFKFSKTLKRDISEYKGYQDIQIYAMNVPKDKKSKMITEMKRRAISWIDAHNGGKKKADQDNRVIAYRKEIRSCKTIAELEFCFSKINAKHKKSAAAKSYFILDLIMRKTSRGQEVEADDVLEYFYTMTSERYTLLEDMTSDISLDYDRYLKEINSIIDRFKYADPIAKSMDMMSFLGMTDTEVEETPDIEEALDEEEEEEEYSV